MVGRLTIFADIGECEYRSLRCLFATICGKPKDATMVLGRKVRTPLRMLNLNLGMRINTFAISFLRTGKPVYSAEFLFWAV